MIYKFRSKATGDLVMLGPDGDQLLRLLGREPAAKGIIEPVAMPAARRALEDAVAAETADAADDADDVNETKPRGGVRLRQRVWPMLQMLERAEAAGEPIVWGA
jgi:hypothetical protein